MTNAFMTRHQNQDKIENLCRSIQHVLDEMDNLRFSSEQNYQEYLCQLKKILPRKEAFALPAEVIAARLSDNEDEQRSICISLRGLARSTSPNWMTKVILSASGMWKRLLPTTTSTRRANALPIDLGGSHLTNLSIFLKIFSSNILTKFKFSAILYT